MKIGIITFAAVANFGANLQAISTYYYLKNHGHIPVIIDWMPLDFQKSIDKSIENIQGKCHVDYIRGLLSFSKLCRNSREVAAEIERLKLDGVIIGSDAVLQHHSFGERFKFPTKNLFYYAHYESTQIFPNVFWGDFIPMLTRKIPVIIMSGSSQSSKFQYILGSTRNAMFECLKRFDYISVRDEWTQKMISHISFGSITPTITPDPVFAFNHNCKTLIPSREEILHKKNLPNKYALISFRNMKLLNQLGDSWILHLKKLFEMDGIELMQLPMPMGYIKQFAGLRQVELPLLPIDWYALIKNAQAYIGENMHPTVVSLANSVPVFCFDDYTAYKFYDMIPIRNSSKIEHIMKVFRHPFNRCDVGHRVKKYPSPEEVYFRIKTFDKAVCDKNAIRYTNLYKVMMNDIINTLNRI